jgi:D-glycero-D-manno-heptose 1,7-bisphosphate phosphatase
VTEERQRKAIFMDRDGTLLVEVGYLNHPSLVVPYHFTAEALRKAREEGFLLISVSNQSGIARGYLTEKELLSIHDRMQSMLAREGAALDGIYYCPHHPEGRVPKYRRRCECRKPGTALGRQAAERFHIDLGRSFMIGDKESDLRFGRSLGMAACLVRTGYGSHEERRLGKDMLNDILVFDNVLDAVVGIL